jgi:V8-like Glu-specific endopeptidase
MRRAVLLSLIAGVALGLGVLGGTADRAAQARTSFDNPSADLAVRAQPIAPSMPPDPAAPVRKATPGTDLANVPLARVEVLESVILPDDDREFIGAGNNVLDPWRRVAYLEATGQPGSPCSGEYVCRCTGFLIGPSTVITAGHCVYNTDPTNGLGGWAVYVRVAPGEDGAAVPPLDEPFGFQVEATDLWTTTGWLDGDAEYDYGAVVVDHAFTGLAGPFFAYANIAAVGIEPRLSGYPGDKPNFQQWWDDDTVTNVAPRIVSYEMDTASGQSGSPVWYPSTGADPTVLAIHTRGVSSPACNATDNCGTRVEETVIANLDYWRSLGFPVGGVAELPSLAGTWASEAAPAGSSGWSGGAYAALAGGLAAAVLTLTAGAWYARRRWLR